MDKKTTFIIQYEIDNSKAKKKAQKKTVNDSEDGKNVKQNKSPSPSIGTTAAARGGGGDDECGGANVSDNNVNTNSDGASTNANNTDHHRALRDKLVREMLQNEKRENQERIDLILRKAGTDSRASGIGSVGGHIARERHAPGPHNGNTPNLVKEPTFTIPGKGALEELTQKTLYSGKVLAHPDWDKNFVHHNSITPAMEPKTYPIKMSRSSTFREEILKFRISSASNKRKSGNNNYNNNSAKNNNKKQSPNHSHSQSHQQVSQSQSLPVLQPMAGGRCSSPDSYQQENSPQQQQQQQQQRRKGKSIQLVDVAKQLWQTLEDELRSSGAAIVYNDLSEISVFHSPPVQLAKITGFMCILLGLQPTWQAARGALFREIRSFLNFLNEVEPLTMPLRRLKKALQYKDSHLADVESPEDLSAVCVPAVKFMRWINAFSNVAHIRLAVEKNKKKQYEVQQQEHQDGVGGASSGESMDDSERGKKLSNNDPNNDGGEGTSTGGKQQNQQPAARPNSAPNSSTESVAPFARFKKDREAKSAVSVNAKKGHHSKADKHNKNNNSSSNSHINNNNNNDNNKQQRPCTKSPMKTTGSSTVAIEGMKNNRPHTSDSSKKPPSVATSTTKGSSSSNNSNKNSATATKMTTTTTTAATAKKGKQRNKSVPEIILEPSSTSGDGDYSEDTYQDELFDDKNNNSPDPDTNIGNADTENKNNEERVENDNKDTEKDEDKDNPVIATTSAATTTTMTAAAASTLENVDTSKRRDDQEEKEQEEFPRSVSFAATTAGGDNDSLTSGLSGGTASAARRVKSAGPTYSSTHSSKKNKKKGSSHAPSSGGSSASSGEESDNALTAGAAVPGDPIVPMAEKLLQFYRELASDDDIMSTYMDIEEADELESLYDVEPERDVQLRRAVATAQSVGVAFGSSTTLRLNPNIIIDEKKRELKRKEREEVRAAQLREFEEEEARKRQYGDRAEGGNGDVELHLAPPHGNSRGATSLGFRPGYVGGGAEGHIKPYQIKTNTVDEYIEARTATDNCNDKNGNEYGPSTRPTISRTPSLQKLNDTEDMRSVVSNISADGSLASGLYKRDYFKANPESVAKAKAKREKDMSSTVQRSDRSSFEDLVPAICKPDVRINTSASNSSVVATTADDTNIPHGGKSSSTSPSHQSPSHKSPTHSKSRRGSKLRASSGLFEPELLMANMDVSEFLSAEEKAELDHRLEVEDKEEHAAKKSAEMHQSVTAAVDDVKQEEEDSYEEEEEYADEEFADVEDSTSAAAAGTAAAAAALAASGTGTLVAGTGTLVAAAAALAASAPVPIATESIDEDDYGDDEFADVVVADADVSAPASGTGTVPTAPATAGTGTVSTAPAADASTVADEVTTSALGEARKQQSPSSLIEPLTDNAETVGVRGSASASACTSSQASPSHKRRTNSVMVDSHEQADELGQTSNLLIEAAAKLHATESAKNASDTAENDHDADGTDRDYDSISAQSMKHRRTNSVMVDSREQQPDELGQTSSLLIEAAIKLNNTEAINAESAASAAVDGGEGCDDENNRNNSNSRYDVEDVVDAVDETHSHRRKYNSVLVLNTADGTSSSGAAAVADGGGGGGENTTIALLADAVNKLSADFQSEKEEKEETEAADVVSPPAAASSSSSSVPATNTLPLRDNVFEDNDNDNDNNNEYDNEYEADFQDED